MGLRNAPGREADSLSIDSPYVSPSCAAVRASAYRKEWLLLLLLLLLLLVVVVTDDDDEET